MRKMKAWIVVSATAVMALAGASSARADQTLVTRVPFDFIVGDARLPAGDYIVTEMSEPGIVSISSRDGEHSAIALTMRAVFDRAVPQAELVFERFSGEHFLAQINGGGQEGREILLTPAIMERELERAAPALKR